ncbi:hypothetical protein ALC60_11534 [Trachymyrmex zeteki]|uniref:Uncharacterized protein n=1 Tax=Mycetomoellerius zeteki TaxID=64791 RepID=A0A151WNN9_9HYME|nr:hypothetical protein ALC60_11534 [Trachymyrmex zeteki]
MKAFHVLLLLALIGIVFAKTTLNQRNEKSSKSYDGKESSETKSLESSTLVSTLIGKIMAILEGLMPGLNQILPLISKRLCNPVV